MFLEDITKWVDDGSPVDVVYFDFQKAFDKVLHQILLIKLKAYGIGESMINWPHLEYCILAWRIYHKKDFDELERVQRRATQLISELKHLCYEKRMLECRLTTLETRRLRGDLI